MPCQGCINRQRKLTQKLCEKRPDGLLCGKARKRLEKMLGDGKDSKNERPS